MIKKTKYFVIIIFILLFSSCANKSYGNKLIETKRDYDFITLKTASTNESQEFYALYSDKIYLLNSNGEVIKTLSLENMDIENNDELIKNTLFLTDDNIFIFGKDKILTQTSHHKKAL